jgi:hypothetical protein
VKIPFAAWGSAGGALRWYDAYNDTKHDRHKNFEQANLGNLTDAIAGLVAVLGAQFYTHGFSHVTLWADDIDEKKRSPPPFGPAIPRDTRPTTDIRGAGMLLCKNTITPHFAGRAFLF